MSLGETGIDIGVADLRFNMFTATGWIAACISLVNVFLFLPGIFYEYDLSEKEARLEKRLQSQGSTRPSHYNRVGYRSKLVGCHSRPVGCHSLCLPVNLIIIPWNISLFFKNFAKKHKNRRIIESGRPAGSSSVQGHWRSSSVHRQLLHWRIHHHPTRNASRAAYDN